ncbi:HdeD family acid-resistance protein [Nocardioides humi]|uniref:HdeD family acid-resistance protein n=1 Tax=Nocardioides humi TaxID=449461 RepID=A0ABN2BXS0_9ACTN|nr:DUF308 domain-containing protein [Nocardioides humi]
MPRDWLNLSWQLLVARGVIGVIFGILAMVWPISTAIALALLWGFWALFDAITSFYHAFEAGAPTQVRVLMTILGLIALAAAFFAIFSPAVTAVTLTWILGIWLIIRGLSEALGAVSASAAGARGLLLASGALDILLGVLFAANPGRGAVTIAFVLGLVAFAWGVVFLATGFVVRRQVGRLPAEPAAP